MTRRIAFGVVVALALLVPVGLRTAGGQPAGKKPVDAPQKGEKKEERGPAKAPALRALLRELLDMKEFQFPMTLKEALGILQEQINTRYKGEDVVPILVNDQAFKDENPEAPDIYDTLVKFPPWPRRMSVAHALRVVLSKVATGNATFLARRGHIEVTTEDRASLPHLLQEKITATFEKRPLEEALEELIDLTGAMIIVDTRLGEKARTPVSARLQNPVPLEWAVKLLAEMAEVRVRIDHDWLFITSKAKASAGKPSSHLRFWDRPLSLALEDLADWSGTTVLLDPRAQNPQELLLGPWLHSPWGVSVPPLAKVPVSATFKAGTSGRTAARILAAIMGLEAVAVDDAVLLTTRELAEQMRARPGKERPAKTQAPK
ncbi:MAG: hypothetical protein L0Z62_12715 [Gemmataceae bacterium]|nr:hypothetical protein [Gemmataceae bacterium]